MREPPITSGTLPNSMRLPALDSDAWVAFLGTFLEGFPDLHWFQIDTLTMFEQLGLRIVPGPRLLPRLITDPSRGPQENGGVEPTSGRSSPHRTT